MMTIVNGYEQSDREEHINVLNLESLEARAEKIIPKGGFGYISGGSEDNWTLGRRIARPLPINKFIHVL